jgi:hypothetical protein
MSWRCFPFGLLVVRVFWITQVRDFVRQQMENVHS